jgi:hypothetical protein
MNRHLFIAALAAAVAGLSIFPWTAAAQTPSGQVAFGQSTIEPAYDDMTGDLIFLLTPNHTPLNVNSNPQSWAPIYLPMYPVGTTVGPLNCIPQNCDHLQVLPPDLVAALGLGSVYPTGTISTKYGQFTGGLVAGHNHLVGIARTSGDFNIAWHVYLILFTPKGVADGATNQNLTTLSQMQGALNNGDAVGPIDSGIVFHCSAVSEAVYLQGS